MSRYELKPNSKSQDVVALKRLLYDMSDMRRAASQMTHAWSYREEYDSTLSAAVRELQRSERLPVTGEMDAKTWAALGTRLDRTHPGKLKFAIAFYPQLGELLQNTPQKSQPKSYVEPTNGNPEDEKADRDLAALLTNGGIARAVSAVRAVHPKEGSSHYKLGDGKVVTIHIYGDEGGNTITGLYLPKSFGRPKYEGGQGIVYAIHKKNNSILGFAHVKVSSQAALDKNHDSGRKNAKGSRYIGDIGGVGSKLPGYIHAHIHYFPNAEARKHIKGLKSADGGLKDPATADSKYLLDVRKLLHE